MLNKPNAMVPYIGIDLAKGEDVYVDIYYHWSHGKMDYYEINGIRYDVSKENRRQPFQEYKATHN